jgi:pyruvate/2-oxoglutarate dehydrogenase complex dihydrolipoamide acyltransferase (E2) component
VAGKNRTDLKNAAMDVCSPKDGFVIKLLVNQGQQVSYGAQLLQMDVDHEDRALARLRLLERARQIRSSQYQGEQLALVRKVAELAVNTAEANREAAEVRKKALMDQVRSGTWNSGYDLNATAAAITQTLDAHSKAVVQQQQLEYSIRRHVDIDTLAQEMNESQEAYIRSRIERMTVLAPVAGNVHLLVGEHSFAELGSVLLTIQS